MGPFSLGSAGPCPLRCGGSNAFAAVTASVACFVQIEDFDAMRTLETTKAAL
jgi:hypothetical protein